MKESITNNWDLDRLQNSKKKPLSVYLNLKRQHEPGDRPDCNELGFKLISFLPTSVQLKRTKGGNRGLCVADCGRNVSFSHIFFSAAVAWRSPWCEISIVSCNRFHVLHDTICEWNVPYTCKSTCERSCRLELEAVASSNVSKQRLQKSEASASDIFGLLCWGSWNRATLHSYMIYMKPIWLQTACP